MAEFCGLDLGPTFGRHPCHFIELPPKKSEDVCMKEFRALLKLKTDVKFPDTTDGFIKRFLIARKYRVEESFQLFVNYHTFRLKNVELFERLNALDVLVQQALRDGFPCVLDQRDRKGRTILVFLTSRWNLKLYSLTCIYRSILLSLEHLIKDQLNQLRGFVVIVDWTEFSFKNSVSLSPRVLKTMIDGLQDCFPAKIKGVHFIGQPWYFETALTIVKPFLKEKSKSKIHLHGNNLSTLHEHVSPDILPPELGGEGPALHPLKWTQTLIDTAIDNSASLPLIKN